MNAKRIAFLVATLIVAGGMAAEAQFSGSDGSSA